MVDARASGLLLSLPVVPRIPPILCCAALTASAIASDSVPQQAPTPPSPRPEAVTKETSSGPQSQTFSEPDSVGSWPWGTSDLTGNWGGFRDKLSDSGVSFNGTATVDLSTVMGDAPKRGFVMPYLVDVNLSLDTGRMGLWQGGEAFIDFQQAGSTNLASDYVPDFWGWDAVYPFAQDFTELGQYWYQQSLADGALRLKLGKIDANVDFAVSYPNLQFVNSAAYMPSVLAQDLPTYPNQAGGFEILLKPVDWIDAKFGMFDGSTNWYDPSTGQSGPASGRRGVGGFLWDNPGSYFLIGEVDFRWSDAKNPGHANIGWFDQTGPSAEPNTSMVPSPAGQADVEGPWGLYTSFSQTVFQPEGATQGQGLSLFGQFGWSPPTQNPSQWSIMGGADWKGILEARPNDTAGLLLAYAHMSNLPYLGVSPGEGEWVAEAFYNIQVTPWLGIQPDLQWVRQPSDQPEYDIGGAWILTFRVSVSF
jgi:porin